MPESVSPQWWISALTSVPVGLPAPGMDHQAGRLVEDDQIRILVEDRQGDCLPLPVSAGSGSGSAMGDLLAAAQSVLGLAERCYRPTVTLPLRISV